MLCCCCRCKSQVSGHEEVKGDLENVDKDQLLTPGYPRSNVSSDDRLPDVKPTTPAACRPAQRPEGSFPAAVHGDSTEEDDEDMATYFAYKAGWLDGTSWQQIRRNVDVPVAEPPTPTPNVPLPILPLPHSPFDSPRGPRDELKHVGKRRPRDTVGSNEPTPDTIIAPLKATVPLLLSPGKDALPSRSPRSPLPSPAYLSSRRRASQRMASAAAAELPSPRPCPRPSGWFVEAADAVADAAAIDPSAAEGAAACVQAKNPSPLKHNAHASEKLPAPASASPLGTMRPSDLEVDPLAEQKPRFSATRVDDSPFIRFKPPQHAQVEPERRDKRAESYLPTTSESSHRCNKQNRLPYSLRHLVAHAVPAPAPEPEGTDTLNEPLW